MSGEKTSNAAQLVSCSFCNKKSLSSEIGEHLMMCGNKTDQCPNCGKYIRRAIFAYHYENDCANLEESDADVDAAANQPDASSTFPHNNSPPASSRLAAENNKQIKIGKVDLSTHSKVQTATSEGSNPDFYESIATTFVCPYCYQEYEINEGDRHRENCLEKPVNIKTGHLPDINGMPNQDRLNYDDQLNNTAIIHCELCNEPIEWRYFEEHMNACAERERERMQNQPRPINEANNNSIVRCKHCNEERLPIGFRIHEAICTRNPRWGVFQMWLRRTSQLPPPYY